MRFLICAAFAFLPALATAGNEQEHVHQMSHEVMPFDMSKTQHIFIMTEHGGLQKVIVRAVDDTEQIALIRQHLQHEAEAFQKGDFGDPEHLHGSAMPGLAEMRASAAKIRVNYTALPDGAQISFDAKDLRTITAIHRWFGAQLSEHGADAKAE